MHNAVALLLLSSSSSGKNEVKIKSSAASASSFCNERTSEIPFNKSFWYLWISISLKDDDEDTECYIMEKNDYLTVKTKKDQLTREFDEKPFTMED